MSLQDGDFRRLLKPGPRIAAACRGLLDLVYPPQSLDGGASPLSAGYSGEAWSRITFLDDPVCDGCGTPFGYGMGQGARCPSCLAAPRAFSRARAACIYDDASRDPILQLKHADRTDLAPLFARWISRAARDLIAEADLLAPVPLHRGRLLRRRFNQAAEMARRLSRLTGVVYLPDALVRRKPTPSQGGRSASGRRRNVAGAFVVPDRRASLVAGRRILLVDDVLTTGATAEACARALLAAGASCVDLAVVARVKQIENDTI